VFPGAVGSTLDCTGLTPAGTTCELVTNSQVKLTLGAAGTSVQGALAGMRNPFSNVKLKLSNIAYKSPAGDGCASTTPTLSSSGWRSRMDFKPTTGILDKTNIVATTPAATAMVGDAALGNVATFVVTPTTSFSAYGGRIALSGPAWFSSTRSKEWPWGGTGFACTCAQMNKIIS